MSEMIIGSVPLLMAFTAAVIGRKKQSTYWLLLFPWFLLYTFVNQWIGFFMWPLFHVENQLLFNVFMLIEKGFYFYVFYSILRKHVFKKIAVGAGTAFLLCYIYDVVIINKLFTYGYYAANAGNLALVICGLLFFTEILISEDYVDIFSLPMFWIATGIIVFAVGVLFYLCFFSYIINDVDKDGKIWRILATILSVIEYSFFTVGFTLKHKWVHSK